MEDCQSDQNQGMPREALLEMLFMCHGVFSLVVLSTFKIVAHLSA